MPFFKEGLDWTLFETSIDVILLEFLVIQSEDNRERNLGCRAGFKKAVFHCKTSGNSNLFASRK